MQRKLGKAENENNTHSNPSFRTSLAIHLQFLRHAPVSFKIKIIEYSKSSPTFLLSSRGVSFDAPKPLCAFSVDPGLVRGGVNHLTQFRAAQMFIRLLAWCDDDVYYLNQLTEHGWYRNPSPPASALTLDLQRVAEILDLLCLSEFRINKILNKTTNKRRDPITFFHYKTIVLRH